MHIKSFSVALCVSVIVLLSISHAHAYNVRIDRFDVSGSATFTDDFDDGATGGWTNLAGTEVYGTWEDEAGNSYANLRAPGFVEPSFTGTPNLFLERSDIFSYNIASSFVQRGIGDFNGVITFETMLPSIDQTYYLALPYINSPSATSATDGIVIALSNISQEVAALLGETPGLTLWQYHLEYGADLSVMNLTDFASISLSSPGVMNTLQLGLHYSDNATQITGSYRFDSSGSMISPLPAISAGNFIGGTWDIGVSESSIVPIPAAVWLFGSGIIGLIGVARRIEHA